MSLPLISVLSKATVVGIPLVFVLCGRMSFSMVDTQYPFTLCTVVVSSLIWSMWLLPSFFACYTICGKTLTDFE